MSKGLKYSLGYSLGGEGSPSGSTVKNLPVLQDMRVRSLHLEDFLEKEVASHSSILTRKIPWTKEPGRLQSLGSQRELDTT